MLEQFTNWLFGYLVIGIKGVSTERFLNLCHARDIVIWDVMGTANHYQCKITIQGFRSLRPIVRKTKTRPYIIKRKGFPFHIRQIKRRNGLWMGGLLFFAIIYMLSCFIWEIQILGQYSYTEEALLRYLREINVYAGMRRKHISCPDIETAIRENYTDIGWVSAELKGSKLFVRIQETNMPTLYETDKVPRHLVAGRSGIVDSIMTRTGTPLVKAGDEVEKGDILISGIVKIYGDSGEVVKEELVRADGDVMIQAETSYYNEIGKKYKKKEYGKERTFYEVIIGNYRLKQIVLPDGITDLLEDGITWLMQRGKEGDGRLNTEFMEAGEDYLIDYREVFLNNSLKLPINIIRKVEREYVLGEEEYQKEEMEILLQKKFNHYLEKLTEKGVIIGENSVKIGGSESLRTISGSFVIFEKADKFRKVSDDEWRIMESDEYSGNNN